MKKNNIDISKKNDQEKLIEKGLRTGGFAFPQTVKDVIEFEKNFGNTDMILPDSLQEPAFLQYKHQKPFDIKTQSVQEAENLAMAAREGSNGLPDDILKLMAEDRKKADTGAKKKKPPLK